jgi:hypothetical protein
MVQFIDNLEFEKDKGVSEATRQAISIGYPTSCG